MQRGNRFGRGLLSAPLWVRVAVTAALGLWGWALVRELIDAAGAEDPRWAAMVFFYLALWAAFTVVVLRTVWRPRVEWTQARETERRDARRLNERLHDELHGRDPRPDLGATPPGTAEPGGPDPS